MFAQAKQKGHPTPKRVSKEQNRTMGRMGETQAPSGMLPNPCNMALYGVECADPVHGHDSLQWVHIGQTSAPCVTRTHLVCKAYWCGAVASSTCFEICWTMVRAINVRMMSPTTMPRMPPSGLRRAVARPIRSPSRTPLGTCPWLMTVAKLQKISKSWSNSTNPRCVRLTFQTGPVRLHDVLNGHSCKTTQDPTRKASQDTGTRGGLLSGLVSCANVAIPGSHLGAVQCLTTC